MAKRAKRKVSESEWEWYGNAAHLIVGRYCRFHMATVIRGHMISTVGEYVHPTFCGPNERTENEWLIKNPWGKEIGCDRKFETMVFKLGKGSCECGCGIPTIVPSELDFAGYNTPKDARAGHMRMCHEWATRLVRVGELKPRRRK